MMAVGGMDKGRLQQLVQEHMDELLPIIKRLPDYARLIGSLAKDKRIPPSDKAILVGGLGYLVSPIDLIPGLIPVVGQMDDILIVLLALRRALRRLSAEEKKLLLGGYGLSAAVLDSDIESAKSFLILVGRSAANPAAGPPPRGSTVIADNLKKASAKFFRR